MLEVINYLSASGWPDVKVGEDNKFLSVMAEPVVSLYV